MYQCICVIDDWSSVSLVEVLRAMPAYSLIDVADRSPDSIEVDEAVSEKVH